jgi:hypothetical protein
MYSAAEPSLLLPRIPSMPMMAPEQRGMISWPAGTAAARPRDDARYVLRLSLLRATTSQTFQGLAGRDAPLAKPGLERLAEGRMMLQQPVDEVVVLL